MRTALVTEFEMVITLVRLGHYILCNVSTFVSLPLTIGRPFHLTECRFGRPDHLMLSPKGALTHLALRLIIFGNSTV